MSNSKHAGGRPPKFREPRKPITVTLPLRTLEQLGRINPDRAKAIVMATAAMAGAVTEPAAPIELASVGSGLALIVVGPSRYLASIPLLRLAEISPDRFILTIPPGTTLEALEVALLDKLEHEPPHNPLDKKLIEELRQYLGGLRRGQRMTKAEILLVAKQ